MFGMFRATVVASLLLGSLVSADDLIGKNGRAVVKGVMVVEETADRVYYQDKSLKRRAFPRSVVARVRKAPTDVHAYLEQFAAAKDADAVMALAVWAEKRRFKKPVIRSLHKRALELDQNHEAANLALGRVKHEGEWMTPAERETRKEAGEEAAMRAKGLVRYKDQWVPAEDKEKLERGLKKHKGRWMTEAEIKEAQGFVKFEGGWVKKADIEVEKLMGDARKDTGLGSRLQLHQTEHYAVMGDLPPAQMQKLGVTMQRLLAEFLRVFPDGSPENLVPGKYRLFAFRKSGPYQRLTRARFKRLKASGNWSAAYIKQEEHRMRRRLRETSYWVVTPSVMSAHVQMPDPFEGLRAHSVHFGANVLLTRYQRLRFPTWWLNEGIAYYFEKKVTGTIQTFSVDTGSGGKYADAGPIDETKKNPWIDAAKWNSLLTSVVRGNRDTKLSRLKSKNLYQKKNRLTIQDIAKAHSIVEFLIRDDKKKFAAFCKDAKTGEGSTPIEREVNAALKHYKSYDEIDKRWRQYALNGFRVSR